MNYDYLSKYIQVNHQTLFRLPSWFWMNTLLVLPINVREITASAAGKLNDIF